MKKLSSIVLALLLAVFFATGAVAGINDRFSDIDLTQDNYISFPEITVAPSTPYTGWSKIYVLGNDIYFLDDLGVTTSMTAAAGGGVIYCDTVELSNADIKALRATKKELVATPGAGYFVEVVSVALILDYGTNVLSESGDDLVVEYATSGDDITAAIEMTGFIDQVADTVMIVGPTNPLAANAAADMASNAVQLFNTGDGEFGDNAGADTTMTVKIAYRIHATGL